MSMAGGTHRRWSIYIYIYREREFSLERPLDMNHFLLAISFYVLAKSGFYLVIFKEVLGVAPPTTVPARSNKRKK
jgi:hypothetical protein